jgi:hypothetical protein
MTKTFSLSDLQAFPTKVQKAIVKDHEDLNGDILAILYGRDGTTVYFGYETADGDEWVTCTPNKELV